MSRPLIWWQDKHLAKRYKNFFLEEGCLERGGEKGDLFQGGCSFYTKNKLKSEIFNDKKCL